MIHFKGNILIVLMITVNYMLFTLAEPTNERFITCTYKLRRVFYHIMREEDLNASDSPINCIKSAIMHLSDYDNLDPVIQGYYNKLSGQARSNGIIFQYRFCKDSVMRFPRNERYLLRKKCCEDLSVFGWSADDILENALRKFRSADDILENALRKFRTCYYPTTLSYVCWPETFAYDYMDHIATVITLKQESRLETPWQYCSDRFPDNE